MKGLAPNTLLQNRYLVVQLIGKGGMGEVYLAVDQRLGSAVALKRTFFSDDEMLGNAFEREARTLARLRHPVLPKVSDHFTENDTQYLAMEHISGDDLSKRLELTDKPFPLSWVLFWTDQLLDALAYLHTHEPPIVHRDIKPQNLKLTDENHIVLLDFGLAKNSIGNTRVTSSNGSIVGYTPHYAPMEQIRGTGTNPRSDLYSLSATVYQLLTNSVPPDALTRADNILNGLPDPIQSLSTVNPEIPKAISDVILKGMSLSMEQRYADARQMQKALREAYAGMQTDMASQTLAFDESVTENQNVAPQTSENSASFNQTSEQRYADRPKTENIPLAAQNFGAAANDFDATIRDTGQDFGIKTEVLPKEKLPRAGDYASPSTENYSSSDNYPAAPINEREPKTDAFFFAPEEDFSVEPKEKGFDPGATVPLINFDQETPAPAKVEKNNPVAETENTFIPSAAPVSDYAAENYAAENATPKRESAKPLPVKPAPQKKSGGKGLAIAAGVGVLLILVVAALGIGWYAMKSSDKAAAAPSPTPIAETTPTPAVTPTIEPTVEPTVEANANTGESNSSDALASDSSDATDTNVKKSDAVQNDTRPQSDRPAQINSVKTPSKATSATNPSHSTTTAAKTPVPQKTPVKSDRTDILQ